MASRHFAMVPLSGPGDTTTPVTRPAAARSDEPAVFEDSWNTEDTWQYYRDRRGDDCGGLRRRTVSRLAGISIGPCTCKCHTPSKDLPEIWLAFPCVRQLIPDVADSPGRA